MGHEVIPIQENTAEFEQTVNIANSCDMFIWQRTPGFLHFDGFEMIRAIKVLKLGYHLDLYMSIERESTVKDDPFFFMDYIFQADGDPESLRKFNEITHDELKVNARWSQPAMYEFESYIAEPEEAMRAQMIFVGGVRNYHPEWAYRRQLIDWLLANYNGRLKFYGAEFGNYTMKHPLNQLMASAKINIGDSICMGYNHENYWSNRVPETLGRGGFMIFPRIKGMEENYKDGEHIVYYDFGDFEQLRELIEYYLTHEKERQQIVYNAVRHVQKNHTFTHRWNEIFETLKSEGKL
jgi:hypothetical protein